MPSPGRRVERGGRWEVERGGRWKWRKEGDGRWEVERGGRWEVEWDDKGRGRREDTTEDVNMETLKSVTPFSPSLPTLDTPFIAFAMAAWERIV